MTKNKYFAIACLLLTTFAFVGCNTQEGYVRQIWFRNVVQDKKIASPITFETLLGTNNTTYDLTMVVRFDNRLSCMYSDYQITYKRGQKVLATDTVRVVYADYPGKWLSKGLYNEEIEKPIRSMTSSLAGLYKVEITPITRSYPTGILSIGLQMLRR